ncbi:HAD family hydrolase [Patescibacteria group bacterium]|nr:HAD family hydrolase [Patescibacteria group bacterium]MBU1931409.1 HAD family hydrolase [Patescibacteria group bacterium]
MNNQFKDIKVLVWDLDGTLYKNTLTLSGAIHANAIKAVKKANSLSDEEAEQLFQQTYKQLASSTQTMIHCGVDRAYALSGKWYAEVQLKHLQHNQRLINMFDRLKPWRHIINTNGANLVTQKKLRLLGLSADIFAKIFTNADMFGKLKPDLMPFKAMLDYTGLSAEQHLMIGDRPETDLLPAKKLGMKTCLVWGESAEADVSVKTVYEVSDLLMAD